MNPITTGQEIQRLRYLAGLTQEELATQLGWHRNTIADYEAGKSLPSPARYARLGREIGLGLSPAAPATADPEAAA